MRRPASLAGAAAIAALCAPPLLASGGPPLTPNYIDANGGSPGELSRLYAGRLPVIMPAAREGMLFMSWRLLHRLPVGEEAGKALSVACCNMPPGGGPWDWLRARDAVLGPENGLYYIDTERRGPDYTSTPNCFPEAFDLAAATLNARVRRHGVKSPWVRTWLASQDGVFRACADASATLPALPADTPQWLRADRAYQEAAFALYHGRNREAAAKFAEIGGDSASPWRRYAAYLEARALHREAVALRDPASFAAARAALARLAATPAGTFGREEADKLTHALDYRERPGELLARLDAELARPSIGDDAGISLRDYLSLGKKAGARPGAADWILTIQADPLEKPAAFAHAREKWAATEDVAWLIAALSLADAGTAEAAPLVKDSGAVPRGHPGWPTVQYHLMRLTLAEADPADMRRRLGTILARPMLTRSERNLFSALRTQVARDRHDFIRFALRATDCPAAYPDCFTNPYWKAEPTLGWLPGGRPVGFGADALAIVDRLPLDERMALAHGGALPRELRLDLALTNFARAVQLHRTAAVDRLARDLILLLPQMRRDWAAIRAARPGPAKLFATYFAMAKIPGLRTDLLRQTRPQGTIRQFQGHWADWRIAGAGTNLPPAALPSFAYYRQGDWSDGGLDGNAADLACLGRCGLGSAPFRTPSFAGALEKEAAAERAWFLPQSGPDGGEDIPAGAVSVWEELLSHARAHPRDPRSPESLYWLIRIARWGPNPDHMGKRSFQLLHRRYPGSYWAKRSPYYYD